MSDGAASKSGGGAFAKVVQKTLVRTKAKVLQNLGKADKTTDVAFDGYADDFHKQQVTALRLQKEMKHYVACVKAMTIAARNLYNVVVETYEADWLDPHAVNSAAKSMDMLYMNYEAELIERVNGDIMNYVERFGPLKDKINKRRRKLLDYDNARHQYDAVNNAKKKDDLKLSKASEALNEAHHMFKDVNEELHKELPQFYEYRVDFLASNFNRLFSAETTFHQETGKLTEQLQDLMQTLATTHQEDQIRQAVAAGGDVLSKNEESAMDLSSLSVESPSRANGESADSEHRMERQTSVPTNSLAQSAADGFGAKVPSAAQQEQYSNFVTASVGSDTSETKTGFTSEVNSQTSKFGMQTSAEVELTMPEAPQYDHTNVDTEYDTVASASRQNSTNIESPVVESSNEVSPPLPVHSPAESEYQNMASFQKPVTNGASHQVIATHAYTAEDEDELSFEAGEIITVIPFDDPEDQDDGWLMGISTVTSKKGIFPENFTQRMRS